VGNLFPAEVRLVDTSEELQAALADAAALVVESLPVGSTELDAAPRLKVVQKYGSITRGIDTEACAARGVAIATIRRRANIACAEHAFALMLTLAKRFQQIQGRISVDQLQTAGFSPKPFDRRHTANSNWARIGEIQLLYGATVGIIGLGEIGREIAMRAAAFGMRVLYYQRRQLSDVDEQRCQVEYAELDELLACSDWVIPQLPGDASTRGLLGGKQLSQMKPGAFLVNVARAEIVDREALLEALRSGRLGGFGLDPLYEEPGRADDPLLQFDNVVLTPHTAAQPRFNALQDIEDLLVGLARQVV
jgi:phosphoglycerate dehydrogenase-like enzyme